MSPYSMLFLANQAIQAGQEKKLSSTKKKSHEEGGRTNNKVGRPDLEGWCPPWATARHNKLTNLKVQSRYTDPESRTDILTNKAAANLTGIPAAPHLTADLMAMAIPKVDKEEAVTATAASAPSFFPMGPEAEVFDLEMDELSTQVKKTVLLTPKTSTPAITRPNSEKIPKAPIRRNSRSNSNHGARKRSFQCEEVMEYAVDTYIWKLKLQHQYHVKSIKSCNSGITGEMRQTLLQWLANISRHLIFSLETWCLAVNYLDRFLALQAVDKECLQLVGLTTLLIAAKIEEQNPPDILELVELCSSAYTRKNFKMMEVIILSKLKYRLLAPTPSFLLSHKVQVMGVKSDWPYDLSRHMVEMILSDAELGQFLPADISSSIYTVIKRSDALMLREVTLNCPVCLPAYGDVYTREFVVCCYNNIRDHLLKLQEQDSD